jgi:hypothetical protein
MATMINTNDFVYRIQETLWLRIKMKNLWMKWRRHTKPTSDYDQRK